MKLVIFGLSISSAWGNGHATLWRGLCQALARAGHTVTFFERDVPYYAAHRDYFEIPGGELVLYNEWPAIRERAAAEVREADSAIVTSYCPDALAATELVASSAVPVRCFYDLDSPVTLARLAAGEAVEYVGPRGYRDYDLVLSYAGGPTLRQLEKLLGARRTAPLYGSVDPLVHYPVPRAAEYEADLSYLGTYAPDRQPAVERLFLGAARELPQRRFLLGGSQYPADFPWTANIFFKQHVPPPRHPLFYSSARVTLNVTRQAMAEWGYCPSGRLFEAAACGSPILSDEWAGLEEFFTPGEEILLGRTTADAVAAVERSDEELAKIAAAARERTLASHTAIARAAELVQALESACSSPSEQRVAG